ncbi:conserved hypothetical protein [Rhodobacteraceae bacterium KLH11]|nr:conserved hypothetical protein [Rhodobacteraceae bacterium KLH11]
MTELFEFELVFGLPAGEYDPFELSDAVFAAGYDEAVIGTGDPRMLAVEIEAVGADAESAILDAAKGILKGLPEGSELREIRPDLVSLADVAERIGASRQALQQREMSMPTMAGLYRVDEIAEFLRLLHGSRRKVRFNVRRAEGWLQAGEAARKLNAELTTKALDPHSLERIDIPNAHKIAATQ